MLWPCACWPLPQGGLNERCFNGSGADEDIVVSSARAYVNALNKMVSRGWRCLFLLHYCTSLVARSKRAALAEQVMDCAR